MAEEISIPCVDLPEIDIPKIPNLQLLGNAELNAFLDFSAGNPTECKLTFNLLLQLSPLLASIACLLKILNVMGKLLDFAKVATDPVKLPDAASDLVDAIEELVPDCIPALAFPQMIIMIKGMLNLIINFFLCFISNFEDILTYKATIDLNAAKDNPVLKAHLLCAQDNADASLHNMLASLKPIQPLLNTITAVGAIGGQPLSLPDVSNISAQADHTQVITDLRDAIESINAVIEALPG